MSKKQEISSSPERFAFSKKTYEDRLKEDPHDATAKEMIKYYEDLTIKKKELEEDSSWQMNNLEYDLRISPFIQQKCKDLVYSQHLYAALCNNSWQKLELIPILKDQCWSCSWRYAGGIIADLRKEGDYIDWYCSGIKNEYLNNGYISEGTVTEEIKNDLRSLGWILKESYDF